ncbi:MAG: 5'-3' exonuclease H3TH domain-containing protein, partial [Bacteroidales bacterium]
MLPKLFLLDAMALIYRAYYAMIKSPRITSTGLNTSAILGFTNTLYEIIKNEKPSHIAVAFDTGAPTLRHADFAAYKANREATPEDIITSIPYIKQVIEAFGIPIISKDGYEADDIIGTLAKKAEIEGFQVFMMTSDKDYGQLVSEHILMFKPAKFGQPAEVVGPEEICEKYSIQRPEQLIDILGLWGDASDNIPGVPGIGEVKAKKLIAQFGSIENIYQKIEEVDNAKLKQTLVDNQEQALVSKVLATIMLDVPIEYHFKEMKYEGPHPEKLRSIFNELEFRSLEKRIFTDLSLQDKPIQPAIPDLFSAPFELEQQSTISSEPIFKCYHQTNHHIIKIEFPDELPFSPINSTLFFDWIFIDAKIAGFAFANGDETVYYHLLENE